MFLLGMNSLYLLGELALGNAASLFAIYLVGAIIHFGVGIIYAIIFALIFAPIPCMNAAVKGIIYGTILTIIAWFALPPVIAKVQDMQQSNNPCMVMVVEEEEVITITENVCQPCNPCMANPCKSMTQMNPCNPCNPCNAATSSAFMGMLISWINHVTYGLVLGLVYCRKKARKDKF